MASPGTSEDMTLTPNNPTAHTTHTNDHEDPQYRPANNETWKEASSPSPSSSSSSSSCPQPPVPPPDGGWGWVVMISSFMVSLCVDGVCFSVGIFFDPLRQHFGSSKAQTAWVGSVLNGSYLIVGPVVSAFVSRYGCRKMAIFGSAFAAVCMFFSTFSPSLEILILTYGFLGGMGFGFVYLPAIVMVGYYFEKRRALATGIACCGSGIGGFIFPPLCNFLLEEYGWKGATWVMSGLVLNAVIFSIFYRPLENRRRPTGQAPTKNGVNCSQEKRDGAATENGRLVPEQTRGLLSETAQEDQSKEEVTSLACNIADSRNGGVVSPESGRDTAQDPSATGPDRNLPVTDSELKPPGEEVLKEGVSNTPPVTLAIPDIIVETADPATQEQQTQATRLSDLIHTVTPQIHAPQSKTFLSDLNLSQTYPNPVARLAFSQGALSTKATRRERHAHHRHYRRHHHNHADSSNPLQRRDIFYSGSLRHIPEYQSSENLAQYRQAVTKPENNNMRGDENASLAIWEKEKEREGRRRGVLVRVVLEPVKQMFDFSLLKSPTFLIYGLSCTFCMAGFFVPFMYMPTLCSDMNMSRTQGALLVSIIGIASTLGRVAAGFVSDQVWADCLLINNLALLAGGGATICVPLLSRFALFAVYSVVFGTAIAVFVSLRSIIMVELMGLEKLTNAFGLVVMCQGISSFVGAPLAGFLSDVTGNYNSSFYVAGIFLALAGAICFPLRRIARWERSRGRERSETQAS